MSLFGQIGELIGNLLGDGKSSPPTAQMGSAHTAPLEVFNDAEAFDVQIEPATVSPGGAYWQAVRVHHLTPEENGGRHHIFIDMLDPMLGVTPNPLGSRAQGARLKIVWEGGEQLVTIDKPLPGPGADFPMWKWQVCTVAAPGMPGDELPSDRVTGLHTGHPDESTGNTLFHHSFSITFVKVHAPDVVYADSVIYGAIRSAAGRTALLIRDGETVASQTIGPEETFRFTDIPAGTYVVGVDGTTLRSTPYPVNGQDQVQLLLTLVLAESTISGRVRNGAGRELNLLRGERVLSTQIVAADESYRFEALSAGVYRVALADTTIKSGRQTLSGANSITLNLVAPTLGKPLTHYVLFGPAESPATEASLLLAQDFLMAFGACFGVSPTEAKAAGLVTIIASESAVSPEIEAELAADGTPVQRISGPVNDVGAALAQRIALGQPFV